MSTAGETRQEKSRDASMKLGRVREADIQKMFGIAGMSCGHGLGAMQEKRWHDM